jgi:hypothetical protein
MVLQIVQTLEFLVFSCFQPSKVSRFYRKQGTNERFECLEIELVCDSGEAGG